jgi:hypothetical protein
LCHRGDAVPRPQICGLATYYTIDTRLYDAADDPASGLTNAGLCPAIRPPVFDLRPQRSGYPVGKTCARLPAENFVVMRTGSHMGWPAAWGLTDAPGLPRRP